MAAVWGIVEYPGLAGLRRLERDWKRLVAAMPERRAHHGYDVHLAYFTHLSKAGGRFICLALTDGTRTRAICPLEARIAHILGWRAHAWELPWDYHNLLRDVICPPDEARQELLPCLVKYLRGVPERRTWLLFDHVLESSAVWRSLGTLGRQEYCARPAGQLCVFDCSGAFDQLATRLTRHFRSNLRNALRKLDALTGVRWVHATDAAGIGREFEAFLELEASGWKGEAGSRTAIRLDRRLVNFYRDLAATRDEQEHCEIFALYAEGRCIASLFCLRAGDECAALKIAYDEGYAKISPGHLVLQRALQWCCGNPGIRHLNMASDAPWLKAWRPDRVPLHRVYVGLGRWPAPILMALLRRQLAWRVGWRRLVRNRLLARVAKSWKPG